MVDILKLLLEEKAMNYKGGLYHETQIKLAYNSNRIEGSSLTEEQTRFMYETSSIVPENGSCIKTDDIVEMNNHFFLFNKMLDTVNQELSQELIKEYHCILKRGTSTSAKTGSLSEIIKKSLIQLVWLRLQNRKMSSRICINCWTIIIKTNLQI